MKFLRYDKRGDEGEGLLAMRNLCAVLLAIILFFPAARTYAADGAGLTMLDAPLHGHEIMVTSPYGMRIHPVSGEEKMHWGIDIGGDEGEDVFAVASGYVIDAGDDGNNGNYIIMSHNGGAFYTAYIDLGDISEAKSFCASGELVERGQVIGHIAGPLAGSTGEHLHFEVRMPEAGVGNGVDPALYHPFAPWLPANASKGGVDMTHKSTSMVWNVAVSFMDPIKKAIDTIAEACTKAVDILKGIIQYAISILMVIDLSTTYILLAVDRDKGNEPSFSIFKLLAVKMLLYLLLFFLIAHWGGVIVDASRDFFLGMGAAASGIDVAQAKQNIVDPTNLVAKGAKIVAPIFTVLNETDASSLDWLSKLVSGVVAGVFIIIIFGSFVLYAMEILFAYIEFYIVSVFSLSTFFFAGVKWTRRFAENSMNGIFSASIKLFFFCFFAAMMQAVMSNMVTDDLIHIKAVPVEQAIGNTNGSFGGREDVDTVLEAIRRVETGGQSDPFHTPSMDGWGYGAYQLSYEYWPAWAVDAGFEDWAKVMPWEEGSDAWRSYADRSQPYSGAWEAQFPPATTPWPENVQTAVARAHLLGLYDTYGNWQMACKRWNGTGPGADAYWVKVCGASNAIQRTQHVLQIVVLLKLAVVCILFVLLGDKLSRMIIRQFGTSNGFKFLPGT